MRKQNNDEFNYRENKALRNQYKAKIEAILNEDEKNFQLLINTVNGKDRRLLQSQFKVEPYEEYWLFLDELIEILNSRNEYLSRYSEFASLYAYAEITKQYHEILNEGFDLNKVNYDSIDELERELNRYIDGKARKEKAYRIVSGLARAALRCMGGVVFLLLGLALAAVAVALLVQAVYLLMFGAAAIPLALVLGVLAVASVAASFVTLGIASLFILHVHDDFVSEVRLADDYGSRLEQAKQQLSQLFRKYNDAVKSDMSETRTPAAQPKSKSSSFSIMGCLSNFFASVSDKSSAYESRDEIEYPILASIP